MFSETLQLYDRLISAAKELQKYLTPQYNTAGQALFKIIDNLLLANQRLLRWVYDYEFLNTSSQQEFNQFVRNFMDFTNGPEYDRLRIHCHEIDSIYKSFLEGTLREWLSNDSNKYNETVHIFESLSKYDAQAMAFVDNIMSKMKTAINNTRQNFSKAKNERRDFLNEVSQNMKKLEEQIDQLRDLRADYLHLSGTIISS